MLPFGIACLNPEYMHRSSMNFIAHTHTDRVNLEPLSFLYVPAKTVKHSSCVRRVKAIARSRGFAVSERQLFDVPCTGVSEDD